MSYKARAVVRGEGKPWSLFQNHGPHTPSQMPSKMVALCNVCARHYSSLCFAFSDADIEFDFVSMTSAYSQYLKDSCKQCLALVGS